MRVYEMRQQPQLLAGSYEGGGLGYVAGQPMDHMRS